MIGRPRPRGGESDPAIVLSVMSLVVAAVVTVSQASEGLAPGDIVVGFLIICLVAAFRGIELPNRAAQLVMAGVLGQGLWLFLAGVLLTVDWPGAAGAARDAGHAWLDQRLPRKYWSGAGWAVLSMLSLPFVPGRARP